MKILIVEDEMLLGLATQEELQAWGHDVLGIAASAEAAFRYISNCPPDLVLMDIVIQGPMNGIALTESIAERHPECKVLFMTAHADNDTAARLKHLNHLGVINKPFDPRQLRTMLEAAAR